MPKPDIAVLTAVWSPLHALHDPQDREMLLEQALHRAAGDDSDFASKQEAWVENPRRVDSILGVLGNNPSVELTVAEKHPLEDSVLLVHAEDFVSWLRLYWAAWKQAGEPAQFGDGECGLLPDTFRYSCCGCGRYPKSPHDSTPTVALLNQSGWWSFDRNAPVLEHTFIAACAAADTALTAAKMLLVATGEQGHQTPQQTRRTREKCSGSTAVAYACCRPPGHHAGRQLCGGLCYFNNIAIAVEHITRSTVAVGGLSPVLPQSGAKSICRRHRRVAIIDIDYHHGNGTQEIFYERSDVLFISIHADPDLEFPYFSGRAEETGHADGRGFNLNIPLPVDISLSSSSPPSLPGSSCASSPEAATAAAAKAVAGRKPGGHGVSEARYLDALDTAISAITTFAPDVLAVSAGFDGFLADQVGGFELTVESYGLIGRRLAALNLPTLLVQEGGYNLSHLGSCVQALLQPFIARQQRQQKKAERKEKRAKSRAETNVQPNMREPKAASATVDGAASKPLAPKRGNTRQQSLAQHQAEVWCDRDDEHASNGIQSDGSAALPPGKHRSGRSCKRKKRQIHVLEVDVTT